MMATTSWPFWLLLALAIMGFWGLVAYAAGSLFGPGDQGPPAAGPSSLADLDEKLARGQISVDEYETQRRHLAAGH